jgi:phosphatidate cytidylyltransferase
VKTRIIAGLAIIAIVIWAFMIPVKFFYLMYAVLAMICCIEYMNMLKKKGLNPMYAPAYAWPVAYTLVLYNLEYGILWNPGKNDILIFIGLSIMSFITAALFSKRHSAEDLVNTVFGCLYSTLLLSFAIFIIEMPQGKWLLGFAVLGGVATDVFAYFTGYFLGKTKIFPRISPKKTVEGSIGGYLACAAVLFAYSLIMKSVSGTAPETWKLAVIIALTGAVAQIGDWGASYMKRQFGIKDFGKLIPGHGGLTDRLDSIVFIVPFMYVIFLI